LENAAERIISALGWVLYKIQYRYVINRSSQRGEPSDDAGLKA
jgi:hypothetical protein